MAGIWLPPFQQETLGLRATGGTDKIGRSGPGGADAISQLSVTMCGWFRRVASTGGIENLLSVNNIDYFETFIDGGVFKMYNDTTFFTSSGFSVPADGRWFFAAMTGDATTMRAYLSYVPGKWAASISAGTDPSSGRDAWFGTEIDGQWFDGDVACMRLWRRTLSSAELFTEMLSIDAVSKQALAFDVRGADRINRAGTKYLTLTGPIKTGSRVLRLDSAPPQVFPRINLPSGGVSGPTAFQGFQSNAFQGQGGYLARLRRTAFQTNAFQQNAFQIETGGVVGVTGTAAITLGDVTVVGTGKVKVQGTASVTLGAVTAAGTGAVKVQGTAAITLGAATLVGTGKVKVQGSLAATLGDVTAVGTGLVKNRRTAFQPNVFQSNAFQEFAGVAEVPTGVTTPPYPGSSTRKRRVRYDEAALLALLKEQIAREDDEIIKVIEAFCEQGTVYRVAA